MKMKQKARAEKPALCMPALYQAAGSSDAGAGRCWCATLSHAADYALVTGFFAFGSE
jgi:hypothetical protein